MRIRFGIFDFDPATRELRREDRPIRLQPQPAQVLGLLLDRPGEVVTREELRQAVWGTETFVDFDRGLNFCVAQIRTALGDSADSPRFIKTLPKRGYQFIAPVALPEVAAAAGPVPPVAARKWNAWWLVGAAAVTIVSAVMLMAHRPAPSLTIAVARFDNETGSADYDRFADGLTDSVVVELANSSAGRYSVIGNAAILRLPRSQRDLLAIGKSLGANYVVLGQVQRGESKVRILVHLIRLPDQKHMSVTRFDRTADDPLNDQAVMSQQVADQFNKRLASLPRPATN